MRVDSAASASVLVVSLAAGCVYLTPDHAETDAGKSPFFAYADARDSTIEAVGDAPADVTTHEPVGDSDAGALVDATDDPVAERPEQGPPDRSTAADDGEEASAPAEACDFYVDPKTGGQDAAFQTITAALLAATATDSGVRTICLAPGIYSQSTNNEAFPLVVRGVRLIGAGPDVTIIQGLARVDSVDAPRLGGFGTILENYVTRRLRVPPRPIPPSMT